MALRLPEIRGWDLVSSNDPSYMSELQLSHRVDESENPVRIGGLNQG